MKGKLFFLGLLLCLVAMNSNAQCIGCSDNGQITETSEDNFAAGSADAYFWEVCSGNATIVGNEKSQNISVTCNEGESTIKVTRFVDGVCSESCKTICDSDPPPPPPCECPSTISKFCMQLSTEGCGTAFFNIKTICLPEPECIESITWQIGLGQYYDEITNNSTNLSWDIPDGDWPNHWLVATAFIKLTSGEICEYGNRILIDCPEGSGHGGENRLANPDQEKSSSIYPNPVSRGDKINLDKKIMDDLTHIDLLDSSGKFLSTLNTKQLFIPSHVAPGVYFLNIHTTYGMTTHKVIVK